LVTWSGSSLAGYWKVYFESEIIEESEDEVKGKSKTL